MVRQGRSTFTVGEQQLRADAGQTIVVPAGTPHTFRTLGHDRYEGIAIHTSPTNVSVLLEADNKFG